MAKHGARLTMNDVCMHYRSDYRKVTMWVNEGCPVVQKGDGPGKPWIFDSYDVAVWLGERNAQKEIDKLKKEMETLKGGGAVGTIADANYRNKIATAELKEYELARIRGETVVISDVIPIVEECFSAVRARILSIPGRVAQEVAIETDAMKVERIIKREVSDALTELSIDPKSIKANTDDGRS